MDEEEFFKAMIEAGETANVEFKRLYTMTEVHKTEFAKDLMALANAHGNEPRYMLLGVDNNRTVYGISQENAEPTIWRGIADRLIGPHLPFKFHIVKIDGIEIGVIEVPTTDDRFYMAIKDVKIPDAPPEKMFPLRRGDIWVRKLGSRDKITPLDMQFLRRSVAERKPEPELKVVFDDGSQTTKARVYFGQIPERKELIARAATATRLFVSNTGYATARDLVVELRFPDGITGLAVSGGKLTDWTVVADVNRPPRYKGTQLLRGDSELIGGLEVKPLSRERFVNGTSFTTELAYSVRSADAPEFNGTLTFEIELVHSATIGTPATRRGVIHPGIQV